MSTYETTPQETDEPIDPEAAAKAILEYYRDTCATHHRLGYVPALYVDADASELRVSRGD
jgi:hypothetical protein